MAVVKLVVARHLGAKLGNAFLGLNDFHQP
jgi:hypothetical protein